MSAITAVAVKELRELSGAGMMDAKKALEETAGDMNAAVDLLRRQWKAFTLADIEAMLELAQKNSCCLSRRRHCSGSSDQQHRDHR